MSDYLLDTHIVLWLLMDDPRLPAPIKKLLDSDSRLCVSALSLAEIAIKNSIGKLNVSASLVRDALLRFGIQEVVFNSRHAVQLATLPLHHRDPFDRMLIAQAQCEGLQLLTADEALKIYGNAVYVV
jgi:PIN domain nuclease of toxin-antitoxin system